MPTAYGYGRVSHMKQQEKGESLPAQEERSIAFYEFRLKPAGVVWGEFFGEPKHRSAYSTPLANRPGGRRLLATLKPGDHLIFDKLDRMWRSIDDFVVMRDWFFRHQIHVHVVNYMGASFEWGSPIGRWIITNMVASAELESAVISDRIIRAKKRTREMGLWTNGSRAPLGTKAIGKKPNVKLVWNEPELETMRRIIDLVDKNWVPDSVAELLERELCAAEGREFNPSHFVKKKWTKERIYRFVARGRWLLPLYPDADPNKIDWKEMSGRNNERKSMLTHLE